jgi:hypothetical protein
VRYEIFHDVLAAAILAWRRRTFVWRRIWRVTLWALGLWAVFSIVAFGYVINQNREVLKEQLRKLVGTGQIFREKAKADLVDETNPIRNVAALRNLSVALNLNPQDTEATRLARDLLLQRVWCPPAAVDVRYRQDALLAATFAPLGHNNEIFAVAGDGQLLLWKGRDLSPVQSLFDKPQPDSQYVVQPGFASFSPNGQWLLIIPPTPAWAAGSDAAAQGAPQPGASPKVQTWRWSAQNLTYESAGGDLEIQRLPGSRINVAWSPESDRVVLISARGGSYEAKCAFFEVEGNTIRELVDRSRQLNEMKIVALAFAASRTGIAAMYVDSAAPALRKVSFIGADDLQLMPQTLNGKDSITLSEDFVPNGIAFGPGNNEITLTSWSGVRILNIGDGKLAPILPPTFRDQFIRIVVGPGDPATRLVATSLYGRVSVAKSARRQEPAEPVVFRGLIGIPQFSSDGQRLLILSGGTLNVFDTMRLIDVSQLYQPQEAAPETFEKKPAPPWLADIAAVSALGVEGDGSLTTLDTLEAVRKKYPESKAGDAYEAVWKRFFPDEGGAHRP